MAGNSGISASGCSQVSVLNDVNGDYISVKCGSIEGKLFFNKLKAVTTVNLGAVKCISYDDTWLTPNEFETRGGKASPSTGRGPLCITMYPFNPSYQVLVLTSPLLHHSMVTLPVLPTLTVL